MKIQTMKSGAFKLWALVLTMSIVMSGLALAPNNANAFWWPHHGTPAHAQDDNDDDDETVTVTIHKYIDGALATNESADGHSFAMNASWDDPDGIGDGSGSFELSADESFKAVTSEMQAGADYSVSEVLDGDIVAATCDGDNTYKLVGYSVGKNIQAALDAQVTTSAPALTDLSKSKHIIVWNETCDDDDDPTATSSEGSISGEVTGGSTDEEPGELAVTSVDAEKTTAVANGEFVDGWKYIFNITVPTDEPKFAMKFADWMQSNSDHTLAVADNMRISSEQASATTTITLTAADTYSSPDLLMVDDLDDSKEGLQVQVLVEVAVPADTYNGTYSTEYGVRTLP